MLSEGNLLVVKPGLRFILVKNSLDSAATVALKYDVSGICSTKQTKHVLGKCCAKIDQNFFLNRNQQSSYIYIQIVRSYFMLAALALPF